MCTSSWQCHVDLSSIGFQICTRCPKNWELFFGGNLNDHHPQWLEIIVGSASASVPFKKNLLAWSYKMLSDTVVLVDSGQSLCAVCACQYANDLALKHPQTWWFCMVFILMFDDHRVAVLRIQLLHARMQSLACRMPGYPSTRPYVVQCLHFSYHPAIKHCISKSSINGGFKGKITY